MSIRIQASLVGLTFLALSAPVVGQDDPPRPPQPTSPRADDLTPDQEPPITPGKLSAVTVYRGQALVTREVVALAGDGLIEMVVSPLPQGVLPNSLASEADEGLRVLSTRYRSRAVQEDTRDEVRDLERQLAELRSAQAQAQAEVEVLNHDAELLNKLEEFTRANVQEAAGKGNLDVTAIRELTDYIRTTRSEISRKKLDLSESLQETAESIGFIERKRQELAQGANREARDAVIVVDRGRGGSGTVRLSYLVNQATWSPQYRLRAAADDQPVRLEYLAAVEQQTGEDWTDVALTLSTARPQLSAVPPNLLALDIQFGPSLPIDGMGGGMGGMGGGMGMGAMGRFSAEDLKAMGTNEWAEGPILQEKLEELSKSKRDQAEEELLANRADLGGALINEAAALEQAGELMNEDKPENAPGAPDPARPEEPSSVSSAATSVTYRLNGVRSVPSRPDQQLVEVARLDLPAQSFFKAVPVLSPQVFRLATLTNQSDYVLLPGEARMYAGPDFVGRMDLPAVAAGEPFTVGFGADPQLQVERTLAESSRSTQGGNQVRTYSYRIRASSYRDAPIVVQVWDRLPRPQTDVAAVSLLSTDPPLSTDPTYLRRDRPQNLLRWDLTIEPGQNREAAPAISYEFKLEYSRNLRIQGFRPGAPGSTSDGEPVPAPAAPEPPSPPSPFQ